MRHNPYTKNRVTIDRKTGDVFNPKAFKVDKKTNTLSYSDKERVFNNQGTLNASGRKEAFETIQSLLNAVSDGTFDVKSTYADEMSSQEGEVLVKQAMSNPNSEEFHKVGQALLNPIKEVIDFEGVSRKIWAARTVKDGDVIRYDKDVHVVGFQIGEDSKTPESVVEGKYIYPPEFEISAFPVISLKDLHRAQYNIMERTQDKAKQAIMYQEDLATKNILQAGGNVENATTFFATLNTAALESIRYQIERHRLTCSKYIINRQEVSDLVNVVSASSDPVTQRELLMAGYIGNFLNSEIVTTAGVNTYEMLDPGEVIAVSTPEYLGGMPIRVELLSEPITQFNQGKAKRGWFWYEMLSMALINPKAVSLGQKTA